MATLYRHMTPEARTIDYAAQRMREIDNQIEQLNLERAMFSSIRTTYSAMVCLTCAGQGHIMKTLEGCECDGPRQHPCPSCQGAGDNTRAAAMKVSSDMEEFLKEVVGVVEATSYEGMCLWREYHQQRKVSWEQGRGGYMPTIGEVAGKPVVLSLLINRIGSRPILFMEVTSVVVDHSMVEEWLKLHLPPTAFKSGGKYINKVDAMNFHNIFP